MRRFLVVLVVPLIVAGCVAPSAPIPRDAGKALYFPTRVGTKWVYDQTLHWNGGFGEVVTDSEEKDGQYLVTVKSTGLDFQDSDSTTISQYRVSWDGVFWVASGLESEESRFVLPRPYCLLKLPHVPGEKWDGDAHAGVPPKVAGKVETVKVPAGTFEAIRVDQGDATTNWYAPGVGFVKYRHNDILGELRSFTLPKD